MQFIFENPIFVLVIIIGIIRSIYKRSKVTNTANSPQEPEWKRNIKYPQTINDSHPEMKRSPKDQRPDKGKLSQDYYEIKKDTEKDKVTIQSNDRKDSSLQRIDTVQKNFVTSDDIELSTISTKKQDVLDGVIWAEIIGPPRALRSYSQRRSTYRR